MFLVVARQSRTFQLLTGLACQVHGKLGGDTARTTDPNGPKQYSVPVELLVKLRFYI